MMRFGLERLREHWPGAELEVLTRDAAELRRLCGDVRPVPYSDWYADHYLLGRWHGRMPAAVSRALVSAKVRARRAFPGLEERVIRARLRLRGGDSAEFEQAAEAFGGADALVVSGAGGVCDTFPTFSVALLRSLEIAIQRGVPTAMFSHGFGPLLDPNLRARARSVLPRVDLIGLREGTSGPTLLTELGVDAGRVVVTGDDGIEIAYAASASRGGNGIGVNVRTGSSAGVAEETPERLAPIVQAFAGGRTAPLIPLPIALQQDWDAGNIERLARGYSQVTRAREPLNTPEALVRQVARCRIVVTGAYHAAVFALAQGIPAVGLVSSPHYGDKFRGLAALFDGGCFLVDLKPEGLEDRLTAAMESAWGRADALRDALRASAARQIRACRDAYRLFGAIAATGRPGPRGADTLPAASDTPPRAPSAAGTGARS